MDINGAKMTLALLARIWCLLVYPQERCQPVPEGSFLCKYNSIMTIYMNSARYLTLTRSHKFYLHIVLLLRVKTYASLSEEIDMKYLEYGRT
jgi:hypothetical protein